MEPTEPATVKTVEHAEASRLPDPDWKWRRLLIFMVCGGALLGLGYVLWSRPALDPTTALFIRYAYYTLWLGLTLYGVGATVTDLATLAAAWRTTIKVTETKAPPPATISTPGATVSTPSSTPSGVAADLPPWKR